MKRNLALAAITLIAVTVTGPVFAEEKKGEVQEIIIKIQTPEGPRWYTLGADLSKVDIRKGAVIRFNYADDTIDNIEVEEVAPGDPPAAKKPD